MANTITYAEMRFIWRRQSDGSMGWNAVRQVDFEEPSVDVQKRGTDFSTPNIPAGVLTNLNTMLNNIASKHGATLQV